MHLSESWAHNTSWRDRDVCNRPWPDFDDKRVADADNTDDSQRKSDEEIIDQ